MENFIYDIGIKAYFGKGEIRRIGELMDQYGKRVLFVFGGGSIRRNGIYDAVHEAAKERNITVIDFGGVESNPTLETVRRGIDTARREQVDCVVAAGGGSSIDCAKSIAAGAVYDGDVWDFYCGKATAQKSLPAIGISTIAASGSEFSEFAVLTNRETLEKNGTAAPCLRLDALIEDPSYTCGVNAYHTAAGVADTMSHVMEGYFSRNDEFMQNRMCEAILKTCIEYGPKVIEDPQDYEARAQIMWASSWGINDFLAYGKKPYFSECHLMGQMLSAKYDITHGVSLAIVSPAWYEFCLKDPACRKRFTEFGRNVWNLTGSDDSVAEQSVTELKEFFAKLGIPQTLTALDCGVKEEDLPELARLVAQRNHSEQWFAPAAAEDVLPIYQKIM